MATGDGNSVGERVSHLEGQFDQMDNRLENVEVWLRRLAIIMFVGFLATILTIVGVQLF